MMMMMMILLGQQGDIILIVDASCDLSGYFAVKQTVICYR
jgi:hypothetical protein